jgi:hypothetical protein
MLNRLNKILVGLCIALVVVFFLWFIFFRPMAPANQSITNSSSSSSVFGNAQTQSNGTTNTSSGNTNTNQSLGTVGEASSQNIFEIAQGPVASAVFMQGGIPTTTSVRYVMADSGHVLDLPIDVPGAVAQAVSGTTIPGIVNTLWAQTTGAGQGSAVLLQYLESGVTKTVFVSFPPATTTASTASVPLEIRFLPDGISSLAVSPNGADVAYLLPTSNGSTGYVSAANGTGSHMLFTFPLAQVTISWPSNNELMLQTKPDANSPGIAFSISTKTGAINQLVYTQGLSAIADPSFSTVVYQTTANGARLTYAHNIATGADEALPYQPIPEKCAWSPIATSTLFCATPVSDVPVNYLDLWHQGLSNAPDSLFAFNVESGAELALASPGSSDGGAAASISHIAISPDGEYLLYITRGDRSLWGVRLTQ